MRVIVLFSISIFLLLSFDSTGQKNDPDSIHSFRRRFKRSQIPLRTDSRIEYRETKGVRRINARNTLTIRKVKIKGVLYYEINTKNISEADPANITEVNALIDYDDLHIISMSLQAKTDSGRVEYRHHRFTGWSQLPQQERKLIDHAFQGSAVMTDAGTPWLPGLITMTGNKKFAIPSFALFSNTVKWRVYTLEGTENIILHNTSFDCWKVNAGPVGPPGYTSYHWYEKSTGRFIKSELVKEGADVKFISEIQLKKS